MKVTDSFGCGVVAASCVPSVENYVVCGYFWHGSSGTQDTLVCTFQS